MCHECSAEIHLARAVCRRRTFGEGVQAASHGCPARVALEDVDELEQDVRLHVHLRAMKATTWEKRLSDGRLCAAHDHNHDHGCGREVGLASTGHSVESC
ncbi:hypothetical protein QYE76_001134 [Lolium multiflorum]|uniref:Uncharacterized protein n=1 Tax=Lolium multiflorum TaxID=4521 RepID=A0AAD8RKL2_LOLMU|nr:hypothetical protein QYE76_001134 [Lolium multiflorum]